MSEQQPPEGERALLFPTLNGLRAEGRLAVHTPLARCSDAGACPRCLLVGDRAPRSSLR
jgi:hypothetical protein